MNSILETIRNESIEAVYQTIIKNNKITRSFISEKTGLSVVTVGKIVDAFASMKIIRQTYSEDSYVGRRSRVISLGKAKFATIYDLTTKNFALYLCDLNLGVVKEYQYRYNNDYLIDENMQFFLESISVFVKNSYNTSHCFGCGFLLPGLYINSNNSIMNCRFPELLQLRHNDNFLPYSYSNNIIMNDIRIFQAQAIAENLDHGISALTLFLDKEDISSCYIRGMDKISSLSFAPFGQLATDYGNTLDDFLSFENDPQEVAYIIAKKIYYVSKAVPFDRVYIFGNKYINMRIFSALVESEITAMFGRAKYPCPTISCELTKYSCIETMSKLLRERWFNIEILKNGSYSTNHVSTC